MSLLCPVQVCQPGFEFLPPFGDADRAVIGDVITAAHESVNRTQRIPLPLGQYEKSVIEILGRGPRDAFADRIGHKELRRGRSPRERDLLRARAHERTPEERPNSLAEAARATRRSFRLFEIAGRFPRTA